MACRADQAAIRGRADRHLKKGIVRDPAIQAAVCADIRAFAISLGWDVAGIIPSPITGARGQSRISPRRAPRLIHHRGEWTRHKIVTSLVGTRDYGARHDDAGNDIDRGRCAARAARFGAPR